MEFVISEIKNVFLVVIVFAHRPKQQRDDDDQQADEKINYF